MTARRPISARLAAGALIPLALAMPLMPAPALAQGEDTPLTVDLAHDTPERVPGARPVPGSLEAGFWTESDKAEKAARTSGERDTNPELNAYVSGVVSRVAGPFSGDVRTYVMDRPFFNASMAPNGYTEVWTGLLLRCHTEDQLAFVVGHESGHFRHSHVIKNYQAMKSSQNAALAASALLAVVALGASLNAGSYQAVRNINDVTRGLIDITYLGTIASLMSYSRETEAQADSYGMTYAAAAGYFPGDDIALWQERIAETQSSDYDKVRRSPARINVFGDHPLEADRITALQAQDRRMNGGKPSVRSDADERAARMAYRDHIRPWLGAWLKDDLRRQDYGQTLYIIKNLSEDGQDLGLLDFYKGEAYRLRDKSGPDGSDRDSAIHAYQAALQQSDAPADTWRELGEMYRRTGNTKDAIDAFKAYLDKAPSAPDAWMVQDQLDTLVKSVPTAATPAASPPSAEQPAAAPSSGGTT